MSCGDASERDAAGMAASLLGVYGGGEDAMECE